MSFNNPLQTSFIESYWNNHRTRLEVVTVFKERESESQTERQQALPGDPAPASERGSKKFDFPPKKNMMLN